MSKNDGRFKSGYEAIHRMQGNKQKRKNTKKQTPFPKGKPGSMAELVEQYLENLKIKNYSPRTVNSRKFDLRFFLEWAHQRELIKPESITKLILESYQRYLWKFRKQNGMPLSNQSQRSRLITVQNYFVYLSKQNRIPANPASELELPRPEKRLPQQALTQNQIKALLNIPDLSNPLGVRDRAILEVFYSTGIRRTELTKLAITDYNQERMTMQIRQGKGHKDRVVPIGKQALDWIERYLNKIRPKLLVDNSETALFLTAYGEPFNPDVISRLVTKFMREADIAKGSCHLLRHSCATHMLEGGADIRFIQQLLGHANLETTNIYTHVSIEQLKAIHSKTHPLGS